MSRRQSRVSIDARQNDTLLEFENFKKRFLLANKHITKLNSTLSVRIEELNAQISSLYDENLRLRASEIALVAQLKKEKEKTRRVVTDAETAIHNFMKHIGHIRKSHHVPHGRSSTPEEQPPQVLRATRRPPSNTHTPLTGRIARAPNFPEIAEDDEGNITPPESPDPDHEEADPSSPTLLRRKSKPRASNSRLPLPTRSSSPPPILQPPSIDFEEQLGKTGKRKPTRRQSGLLTTSMSITTVTEVIPPRPPSPAFGSPLRRDAALEEEEEEVLAVIGGIDGREEVEPEIIAQTVTRREKKKAKEKDSDSKESSSESGRKSGERERERERKKPRELQEDQPHPVDGGKKSKLKDVTNASPPSSRSSLTPIDTLDHNRQHTPDADIPSSATSTMTSSSLLTSRTFLTTPATTPAPTPAPKHYPADSLLTPRSSSPIQPPVDGEPQTGGRERRVRKSVNYAEPKLNTKMRKPEGFSASKRTSTPIARLESDSVPRSSLELPPLTSSSSNNTDEGASQPTKRKRPKTPAAPEQDDEESDGTQADAEFGPSHRSSTGYVNIDGRRRSVQTGSSIRRLEGDDLRRHSLAV